MTNKEKLVLFLIASDPGLRDIYSMVKIYGRAGFRSKMDEILSTLFDSNFIYVTKTFDNGTPNEYAVTEMGNEYLKASFKEVEIIDYIKTLDNPDFLLKLAETCISRKNGL